MSHPEHLPKIGISLGDINGIGPELLVRLFSEFKLTDYFVPVIYGSSKVLNFYRKLLPNNQETGFFFISNMEEVNPKKVNVLNVWDEEVQIEPGKATPSGGKYALLALDSALADYQAGKIQGLVTLPLNKNLVDAFRPPFSGHTGYIAQKTGGEQPLMMLVGENLKVALATIHLPLSEVAAQIKKENLMQTLRILNHSLQVDFGLDRPKIAVLGLNPHAGENGLLGKEELEEINPAVKSCQEQDKMLVYGAYPADGFFASGQETHFDAILAMYHDQGLIPFKSRYFNSGVNYTAGLPIIRTSPDHGTAYDLAGKGTASYNSLAEAMFLAVQIYRTRIQEKEIRQNPLEFTPLKRERFRLEFK